MRLTKKQNEMLEGKYGYPVQKAMEILVGLGECYDAKRLIPVKSVHLAVNSAFGAGDVGIDFISGLADKGGKFVTFADTNPVTTPYGLWKELGISEEWARKQDVLTDSLARMGAYVGNTCSPYLVGHVPRFGEHIAWSETSATVFTNAVLGARTNREGGPSSLASALTGLTPECGFHLDENRYGDVEIMVSAKIADAHDYGALGYFAGRLAQDRVPVFVGLPPTASWEELILLCAGCATSGSVAHLHAIGITPEAPTREAAFGPKKPSVAVEYGKKEQRETEELIHTATSSEVDLVIFGCPHYSIGQIAEVARLVAGKKLKREIWIQTAEVIKSYARRMGCLDTLEAAGVRILGEGCQDLMPPGFFNAHGYRNVASDSAKLAFYIKGLQNVLTHFGSVSRCVEAAISGVWR